MTFSRMPVALAVHTLNIPDDAVAEPVLGAVPVVETGATD